MNFVDRVIELKNKFQLLRNDICPYCRCQGISWHISHENTPSWKCRHCAKTALTTGIWAGGHGWLSRIEGEWLIVDNGYEESLQADLESLKAARLFVKRRSAHPKAVIVYDALHQIDQCVQILEQKCQCL